MSHYKEQAHKRDIPICPQCNKSATETETKYGLRNQCDDCELWSWDRYPLTDAGTHAARNAAHRAFDMVWKNSNVSRSLLYKLLANELDIDKQSCHMKLMDKELASKVPAAIFKICDSLQLTTMQRAIIEAKKHVH